MNTSLPIRLIHLPSGRAVPLSELSRCVIALGNFDGVHTGHRLLLAATVRMARELPGSRTAVFCFDPPSSSYMTAAAKEQLSPTAEKLAIFAECGIEYAILADFPALRDMSAETFVREMLLELCHATHIVCGFHYHFGKQGSGDVALLRHALGRVGLTVIPPCLSPTPAQPDATLISSSAIRAALETGDITTARRLLGRPYTLCAPIVHGKQLGRQLGIPTINQFPPSGKLLPAAGVYATRVHIKDASYIGVSNVGVHPTVDRDAALNCETYLLNFDREVYGAATTVEFMARIRPERQFDSLQQLQAAIANDIQTAKEYFDQG